MAVSWFNVPAVSVRGGGHTLGRSQVHHDKQNVHTLAHTDQFSVNVHVFCHLDKTGVLAEKTCVHGENMWTQHRKDPGREAILRPSQCEAAALTATAVLNIIGVNKCDNPLLFAWGYEQLTGRFHQVRGQGVIKSWVHPRTNKKKKSSRKKTRRT